MARDLNKRYLFDGLLPRPSLHSDQMRFLTLHIVNNFHTCADLNYFPYHSQQTNSFNGAREPVVPPALEEGCAFPLAPRHSPRPPLRRPPAAAVPGPSPKRPRRGGIPSPQKCAWKAPRDAPGARQRVSPAGQRGSGDSG